MQTSYLPDDVEILLKDITGLVEPLSTEEREKRIQSGVHYCEMLPLEYKPTNEYISIYEEMLDVFSSINANAIGLLADKLYKEKGDNIVLVSLARAGIPIGILLKRYFMYKYDIYVEHYAISIIRGRGIDKNALDYILKRHDEKAVTFVDGWTGKGAINNQLQEALVDYPQLDKRLAVVADPANVTDLCGTHEDILIPSSCLNSTVSGLISRTFLRDDIIKPTDFHGAIYYDEYKDEDRSYEFIDTIEKEFHKNNVEYKSKDIKTTGLEETKSIADEYGIKDINLIKPSIGETTRVLLRRVPDLVIINESDKDSKEVRHIIRLAKEKGVKIVYKHLNNYKACGIIKELADA